MRGEPPLIDDILIGARALVELDGRWAATLIDAWQNSETLCALRWEGW